MIESDDTPDTIVFYDYFIIFLYSIILLPIKD